MSTSLLPPPPCPTWCSRGAAHHAGDRDSSGELRRIHSGVADGVERVQFETSWRDGAVVCGAVQAFGVAALVGGVAA